ncbi:MAG: ATP-binding protein [Firmicutes bacterium]|nr:ATP-binding protein [Bacillota bacterium]
MTYKYTIEQIVHNRKLALEYHTLALNSAIENDAVLFDIEKNIRTLSILEAKGDIKAKKQLLELQKQKDELLKKAGLSLTPPSPECKKCNDTGFVCKDYCKCVSSLALNKTENIEIPTTPFSKIDYKRFDSDFVTRNKGIYEDVQKICNLYPNNKRRVITLLGGTGNGKTLLAGATANEFLSRGFCVVAVTAFGFINRTLKYHTTFDDNKLSFLEPLLEADLLVIDDLGTESILKNITNEYLYLVLNERINTGKLTFITTNLSKDGIEKRYGTRIYSRLFDKNLAYSDALAGKDMRTAK